MSDASTRVQLIVAPDYGERLCSLPGDEAAWVANTLTNQAVIKRLWAARPTERRTHLTGITWFQVATDKAPEDWLIDILDVVELHHGEYSQTPPYSDLKVVGASLSPRLKAEFEACGFVRFEDSSDGFIAYKLPA